MNNPVFPRKGILLPDPLRPLFLSRLALVACLSLAWLLPVAARTEEKGGGAPSILVHPQPATAGTGGTVTFSVTASSTLALSYQWRFNGLNIGGATGTNLVLTNVQPAQIGYYSVLVTNVYGSALSTNAPLDLTEVGVFRAETPILVPDVGIAALYPSSIEVTNLRGTVTRLTVNIQGLVHPAPDDLDLLLVSPEGSAVVLMSDAGGQIAANDLWLEFDDDAADWLPDEGPSSSGTFRPSRYDPGDSYPQVPPTTRMVQRLSELCRQNPNGSWSLYVLDDSPGNGGVIANGWGLELATTLKPVNAFAVTLSGRAEVPPNASLADGQGTLNLLANGFLSYDLAYANLTGSFLAAYLCGPAAPWTNAPPLAPALSHQAGNQNSGILRGTNQFFSNARQVWDLRNGLYYVNVQSQTYPTGEVRGQILALAPPDVLLQPQDLALRAGEPAMLTVAAGGWGPFRYQWRLDGRNLPGATNAVLVLTNLAPGTTGTYDVMVGNAAGWSVSSEALVQVIETIVVPLGSRGSRFFTNSGAPRVGHWTACGQMGTASRWLELAPQNSGVLIAETTGSAVPTVLALYQRTNAASLDYFACDRGGAADGVNCWEQWAAGPGMAYALEVDGQDGKQGMLQLNWRYGLPPVFFGQPEDALVLPGGTLQLQAEAAGTPPPQYAWFHNGTQLPGASVSTLTVTNFQDTHAGEYWAIASNLVGTATSAVARVTLSVAPLLIAPRYEADGFKFRVSAPPGSALDVLVSTDLVNWVWRFTTNLPSGTGEFVDPEATAHPRRFYRLLQY